MITGIHALIYSPDAGGGCGVVRGGGGDGELLEAGGGGGGQGDHAEEFAAFGGD